MGGLVGGKGRGGEGAGGVPSVRATPREQTNKDNKKKASTDDLKQDTKKQFQQEISPFFSRSH